MPDGATIYPQNIGLGAARDPQLLRAIGRATAEEVRAVGLDWTFGPTLAVVSDECWGRTYESDPQNPQLAARYARQIVLGLLGVPGTQGFLDAYHMIATPKHFVGDGGTLGVDQGNHPESETVLRARLDDSVRPVLRVKLRAHLFSEGAPCPRRSPRTAARRSPRGRRLIARA